MNDVYIKLAEIMPEEYIVMKSSQAKVRVLNTLSPVLNRAQTSKNPVRKPKKNKFIRVGQKDRRPFSHDTELVTTISNNETA